MDRNKSNKNLIAERRKQMATRLVVYFVLGVCFCLPVFSWATAQDSYTIAIKNHQFNPSQLTIPVDQKIRLTVENQDPTAEEFESFDLNREKVVSGNKKILVFIGPLKKGTYKYFGDFHQNTAQGVIVVQ
jgi:plastocyanin